MPSALTETRICLISLARIMLFATFMTIAATLPLLIQEWSLSATAAGGLVTSFTLGYALSLFLFAWGADHLGAKRMVAFSALGAGISSLLFAIFARDWNSAFWLYGLIGLCQGGVYTPLIVLISDEIDADKRGHAMGMLIASTSIGYAASLALCGIGIALGGWKAAFMITGFIPILGAGLLIWTLKSLTNRIHPPQINLRLSDELIKNQRSRLLNIGYIAHNWELLGMWAWIPGFLAAGFVIKGLDSTQASMSGAYLSGIMHLFGAIAAFSMGRLSDRLGRQRLLIILAAGSTLLSFSLGWLIHLPLLLLMLLVLAYAFMCLGDSPILTTALSEAVRPGYLGRVLAWRSLLGFIAGALAPLVFGGVLDLFQHAKPTMAWGMAFASLGLGGAIATYCAFRLQKGSSK